MNATETVRLWFLNDEGLYRTAQAIAENDDLPQVADDLENLVRDEMNPLVDRATLYADLLTHALSDVDWDEIANVFLEDE